MKITMQSKNETKTTKEAFQEFIKYCKVKNLSEHTIIYYERCFGQFTQYFSESRLTQDINKNTVDDFTLWLRNNTENNNISINTRLRGVRAILNYFMELDYTPKFKIRLIKAEKEIKDTYTDAELKILLEKPNLKKCKFTEYRTWAMINYLLATGNRVGTVINVKISDVDFDGGYIKLCITKNKKQQIIPLSDTLAKILMEYLMYRKGETEDYLFCNQSGKQLTENAMEISIRSYNQRHGVMKTSSHLFRHTFAKKWMLSGGDIFRLQKMLGHSSLDIVREYVNMFSSDLKKDFSKFNALEQMATNQTTIKMR